MKMKPQLTSILFGAVAFFIATTAIANTAKLNLILGKDIITVGDKITINYEIYDCHELHGSFYYMAYQSMSPITLESPEVSNWVSSTFNPILSM